jgi:hypothetical protein
MQQQYLEKYLIRSLLRVRVTISINLKTVACSALLLCYIVEARQCITTREIIPSDTFSDFCMESDHASVCQERPRLDDIYI